MEVNDRNFTLSSQTNVLLYWPPFDLLYELSQSKSNKGTITKAIIFSLEKCLIFIFTQALVWHFQENFFQNCLPQQYISNLIYLLIEKNKKSKPKTFGWKCKKSRFGPKSWISFITFVWGFECSTESIKVQRTSI